MRNFFVIIFLAIQIFANSTEFANFDNEFLKLNKSEQLSVHQKLKNIYVKSIVRNDKDVKIDSLKRLYLSSKVLNLNASTYEKELRSFGINPNNLSFKALESKKSPQVNVNKNTTKNTNESNVNKKAYVVKVEKKSTEEGEGILLYFKNSIDLNTIKNSVFNGKTKNKILDFQAALDIKMQIVEYPKYIFKVAQYNPQTIRVVFSSDFEYELKYKLIDNNLFIYTPKILEKKATATTQPKQNKTEPVKKENNKIIENKTPVKPKENVVNNAVTNQKIYIKKIIKKEEKDRSGVILNLSSDLNSEMIKTFSYQNNSYLEFDGVLNGGRRNIAFKDFTISVLQYTPQKVRIMLSAKKLKPIGFTIGDNQIYIYHGKTLSNIGFDKSKLLIAIDAGHGGKDGGANANGKKEKDITLAIALKLEKALKAKGYNVFLTRNNDTYISLRDRTKMANDKKSDLFISIHANSLGDKKRINQVYGIETYFLSPARSERSKNAAAIENKSDIEEMDYFSKQTFLNFLNREKIIASNKLAIDIQSGILNSIPKTYLKKDGGVKEAPFWVLVGALMPAVLIEVGYITHKEESTNLANANYQTYLANGIVQGIENYFEKNK